MKPALALYAPLKPPDHPIASGDREIARLMMAALERAGYEVRLASRFVAYQKQPPDSALFDERRRAAFAEAERLEAGWRGDPDTAPDLWFTYHPYCKAPDWIGPRIARALSIPYVTAEACRTGQGTDANWREGRAAVQDALRMADANFCLKSSDERYLRTVLPDLKSVVPMRPFLDVGAIARDAAPLDREPRFTVRAPLILAVGMMRPGTKIASYRLLAESLSGMTDISWNLMVIGDGPARQEVEAMFGFAAPERVHFAGALPHTDVLGWMKAADLLAWPGVGEAIGMVYLEAQVCGLPVAACDVANVATVVANGDSGLLARDATTACYRAALEPLLADRPLRLRLGEGARRKAAAEHDIAQAAALMKATLDPIIARRAVRHEAAR